MLDGLSLVAGVITLVAGVVEVVKKVVTFYRTSVELKEPLAGLDLSRSAASAAKRFTPLGASRRIRKCVGRDR